MDLFGHFLETSFSAAPRVKGGIYSGRVTNQSPEGTSWRLNHYWNYTFVSSAAPRVTLVFQLAGERSVAKCFGIAVMRLLAI